MGITHKAIAALVGVFLALLAGATVILDRAVRPEFEQLEANAHARDEARVLSNLDSLRDDMRQRVNDYAAWDDTYEFAAGRNAGYPADYDEQWFADYGIDLFIVADERGRIRWAAGSAARGAAAVARGADAQLLHLVAGERTPQEPVAGVAWVEGFGFAVYSAGPILRTDRSGPASGTLIFVKRLSEAAISTQVQLDTVFAHRDTIAPARLAALGDSRSITWKDPETLTSLIALRDSNGALVGAAMARQSRDITALGQRAVTFALLLLAGIAALLGFGLWALLRFGLLRRLQRLERHFNAQGEEPQTLANDGMRDELSRLTDAYNALVQRASEAARIARDARRQRDTEINANRMKSDFLANISHELRAPLNHVIGYAELIEEDIQEGRTDACTTDLQRICSAARHVLALTHDIMELSRIEAGTLQLRPHAFNVAEMAREAVSVCAGIARERNCEITLDIQDNVGVAYSDQARVRQCLISALTHACSNSDGAAVHLSVRRVAEAEKRDEIEARVECQSTTLRESDLDQLFEPYAEANAAGRSSGAGLGLSVTRRVLTLLGGRIDASVQNGLTFVLRAPVVLEEKAAAAA